MTTEITIGREEFLALGAPEVSHIVRLRERPKAGVFIADGNRRLVMCRTGLSPTSPGFYLQYARFFVDSLKESLSIFFDHALETLFFPLYGPSVPSRARSFRDIVIPSVYRAVFLSPEWLQFFNEKGIRVKVYGDLSELDRVDPQGPVMAKGIRDTIEKTAMNTSHTLYFGFMAEPTAFSQLPSLIIAFYQQHHRTPTLPEMVQLYYGDPIPPVDFIIFSEKLSIRALPPFVSAQDIKAYYLPVPGFLGLNALNYKKILYDLLYMQPTESVPEYPEDSQGALTDLDRFYGRHTDTVIGLVEKIDPFVIPKL